ncbi:hypothetical protein N1851_008863 [Merluccius polli]|uniref:Uncharacterized protein n=1 Tax=Merluccius polli TaxID=89951 RepID=A0AA47P7F9_MERPO|nr:hypothetical protein N1851_008863 [Merluccius polli]
MDKYLDCVPVLLHEELAIMTPRLSDTPPDLLLPSTFQPSVQSEGKPPLARHSSVALPCSSSTLEGGRTLSLGCTTPTGREREETSGQQAQLPSPLIGSTERREHEYSPRDSALSLNTPQKPWKTMNPLSLLFWTVVCGSLAGRFIHTHQKCGPPSLSACVFYWITQCFVCMIPYRNQQSGDCDSATSKVFYTPGSSGHSACKSNPAKPQAPNKISTTRESSTPARFSGSEAADFSLTINAPSVKISSLLLSESTLPNSACVHTVIESRTKTSLIRLRRH